MLLACLETDLSVPRQYREPCFKSGFPGITSCPIVPRETKTRKMHSTASTVACVLVIGYTRIIKKHTTKLKTLFHSIGRRVRTKQIQNKVYVVRRMVTSMSVQKHWSAIYV